MFWVLKLSPEGLCISEPTVLVRTRKAQKHVGTTDILAKWHLSDRPTVQIRGPKGWPTKQVHFSLREAGNCPKGIRWRSRPWGIVSRTSPSSPAWTWWPQAPEGGGALSWAAGLPKVPALLQFGPGVGSASTTEVSSVTTYVFPPQMKENCSLGRFTSLHFKLCD